jgi:transcriptional regulator with XRE-family HTH domain
VGVDHSQEVREYLTTRRARISPEDAGIIGDGEVRRVAGLRREEVAALAGMSIDYYKRLERGNLRGVSDAVLEALGQALQLNEAERTHLANLTRAANQTIRSRSRPVTHAQLNADVADLLDQLTIPATVANGLLDILGANDLGRMLFSGLFEGPDDPPNYARAMFLDPRSRDYWVDWEATARSTAAILRMQLGRHPEDPVLAQLIAGLAAQSADFRRIWSLHDVELHRTGRKAIRHPLVGEIEFAFQTLEVATEAGPLVIGTFSVEPGSASEAAFRMLSSARI